MEKMDVLEMLREAEDIYVIYSACTNMPFVYCDPETYDDEVILFDSEEEAKKQAAYQTLLAVLESENGGDQ